MKIIDEDDPINPTDIVMEFVSQGRNEGLRIAVKDIPKRMRVGGNGEEGYQLDLKPPYPSASYSVFRLEEDEYRVLKDFIVNPLKYIVRLPKIPSPPEPAIVPRTITNAIMELTV